MNACFVLYSIGLAGALDKFKDFCFPFGRR